MAASPTSAPKGVDAAEAWSRFKDRLHAFARRRLRSNAEADDVVQDVLLRLLRHRHRIEPARLAAWLFTTARNVVIDRRRAPGNRLHPENAAAEVEADQESRIGPEGVGCMQPLLAMLSAEDRAVLEQVDLSGRPQAQLALSLNLPISTVKSRVQRARERLRAHLEQCCRIELDGRGMPHDLVRRAGPQGACCDDCGC